MVKNRELIEKTKEAMRAVLPIMGIVLLLSFTVAPMPSSTLLAFMFGGQLLILGMVLFSMGADQAMQPIGARIGARLTRTRKLWLILLLGFLLGFMITISEPDLQVLANQVSSIPDLVLIFAVAFGVAAFLVIALVRVLVGFPIRNFLMISYALVFVLAIFAPKDFLAVAFDSGGVTTGPMTVPFIMAFGVGISAIRNDKHAMDDSFGMIALCSVGPILAVLILSLIYSPQDAAYDLAGIPMLETSMDLSNLFLAQFPKYLKETSIALLPIALFFYIFQLISLKLNRHIVRRITIGIIYTYTGLVIFLTGVNVGFMPAGTFLGQALVGLTSRWTVIPLGMLIGYFIVKAEPAVYVLSSQVEEITDGEISGRMLQISLSVSVCLAVGLALFRMLKGIPILLFVGIGYAIAIGLSFFVPKVFTAIAFDSGGVASGPMTTTFLLPFAMGACLSIGGDIIKDAFGVVAMVALMPILTLQLLGLVYRFRQNRNAPASVRIESAPDAEIIEL